MTEHSDHKCSKCGGTMTRGFVADRDRVTYYEAKWVEGDPEHDQLFGFVGESVATFDRQNFVVRSMRCEKCGFLELYAV